MNFRRYFVWSGTSGRPYIGQIQITRSTPMSSIQSGFQGGLQRGEPTRRDFVKSIAGTMGVVALSGLAPGMSPRVWAAGSSPVLRVGVIGCGGRGTGAAADLLTADETKTTRIFAMADAFSDRLEGSLAEISKEDYGFGNRIDVPPERRFVGLNGWKRLLSTEVDIVILATPPGFRPIHLNAAVAAGKHVFMEKPVAVCSAGVRMVIDAARLAQQQKTSIVAGTQRRHEKCYQEAFQRIEGGEIGKVLSAAVYWNQGGLWNADRREGMTDVEWQIRNWLYFAWLSGDHIVEQHVHNLDVALWAMGAPPARVTAMGGRQVRTDPKYGHVFDHFACEYEYDDGRRITSQCRQIDGCTSRVDETIYGSEGFARLAMFGTAEFRGKTNWKWQGKQTNPYVQEHVDLLNSIRGGGPYVNHGERIAQSTLMAIMGRMSAYTGKTLTWQQAMDSKLDLMNPGLEFGPLDVPPVPVPGREG
jgi:predicted dehydrogenase